MEAINIPNALTAVRIIIIPVFVTAMIYRRYDYALYLFGLAAITDAFDGLIARATGQSTALGTFLDPLADKFLLITSFVLFSFYGLIPIWLTITIISRDIIVITGWIVLYLLKHIQKVETVITGKIAIAFQLILLFYTLLVLNASHFPDMQKYLLGATALFTIISGLHYIYRGFRQSNA